MFHPAQGKPGVTHLKAEPKRGIRTRGARQGSRYMRNSLLRHLHVNECLRFAAVSERVETAEKVK